MLKAVLPKLVLELLIRFQVNGFVGAFHDAVVLYAMALNETIAEGQSITNGTAVTRRMWNKTFNGIFSDYIL